MDVKTIQRLFAFERPGNWWGRIVLGASLLASVLSLLFITRGMYLLLFGNFRPGDLDNRWLDHQYFFRRINANDVFFGYAPQAWGFRGLVYRSTPPPAGLRIPQYLSYPSYSLPLTSLLYVWPFAVTRVLFFLANVLALGILARWAWSRTQSLETNVRFLIVAGALSFSSYHSTLIHGNYGILLLAGLAIASEKQYPIGMRSLALAFALTKVNCAGPFVVLLLFQKQYRVLWVTGAILITTSLIHSAVVMVPCWIALGQFLAGNQIYILEGSGLINVLNWLGAPRSSLVIMTAVPVLTLACVAFYRLRNTTELAALGVGSLTARLWTYHGSYEDMVLFFFYVAFCVAMFRSTHRKGALFAYFILSITFWIPVRSMIGNTTIQVFQHVIWLGFGIVLYLSAKSARPRQVMINPPAQ